MIAAPPPHPQERDKSINNLLIYFTSLSSNLIAGSFVSVEGVEGGRLGGVNKGRAEGCRGVEEGNKKFCCSVCARVVSFVHAWRSLSGAAFGDSAPLSCVFAAATLPPLVQHTHTRRGGWGGGQGKKREEQCTNYQKEKN